MQLAGLYLKDLVGDLEQEKKIILYGSKKETEKLIRLADLYGCKIAYVVNNISVGNILSYLDLLYEDPDEIFVLICKENGTETCKKLMSLGLQPHTHFREIFTQKYRNMFQQFPLDVNIGYTYHAEGLEKSLPGVTVFGDRTNTSAYKICTLGGSTSDSQAFVWKSWSEFLFERLRLFPALKECGVVVYSAGVAGYRSAHELLKLERDLLNLKPDMVISFSGFNDASETKYPFVQHYSQEIFDIFCNGNLSDIDGTKTVHNYSCGFERQGSMAENWMRHMRMMNSVCREFGIAFFSLLQPMLGSKRDQLSTCEWEAVLNGDRDALGRDALDRTEVFLTDVKEQLEKAQYDYIYDISDLFDTVDDVYIDVCHVTEKGNSMIAEKISSIIAPYINMKRKEEF